MQINLLQAAPSSAYICASLGVQLFWGNPGVMVKSLFSRARQSKAETLAHFSWLPALEADLVNNLTVAVFPPCKTGQGWGRGIIAPAP